MNRLGEKKWSVSHPINNRVSVGQGDLTTLEIDAVVTSATTDLIGAGGSGNNDKNTQMYITIITCNV
jgi:hypothetical protein